MFKVSHGSHALGFQWLEPAHGTPWHVAHALFVYVPIHSGSQARLQLPAKGGGILPGCGAGICI